MKSSSKLGKSIVTTIAAISLSAVGITPAFAEDPSTAAEGTFHERQDIVPMSIDESVCDGVSFPLTTTGESYRVSDPSDSNEQGTLRWAIAAANEQAGINEIVIAAELSIDVAEAIIISDGLVIRGEGSGAELRATGDEDIFNSRGSREDFAVEISNLTLTGVGEESTGLDFERSVCALALHDVVVQNFNYYGVMVGDTWPFVLLDVENSTFQNNGSVEEYSGYGALTVSNEGIGGAIHIHNSDFVNNRTAGLVVDAGLESTPEQRAEVIISNSSFLNNSGGGNAAGGITLNSVYVDNDDSSEGDLPMPSTPVVTVNNSLFAGNSGTHTGGISLEYIDVYRSASTVSVVSVENSTFTQNGIATAEPGEVVSSDLWFGDSSADESLDVQLVSIANSTFTDPADPSLPIMRLEQLTGHSVLNQVTMVGGGLSIGNKDDDGVLNLMNSVIDTGSTEPVSEQSFRQIPRSENGLAASGTPPYVEQNMAYSYAPSLVPAGAGRLVGSSVEFALEPLDATLGPTPVRVPGAASTLLDAAGLGGPAVDQRGLARPQGVSADIGAVERQVQLLTPSTVTLGVDQSVESGGTLVFQALRENAIVDPWTGVASVRARTVDGTAISGTDYTGVDVEVIWQDGDTAPKAISVNTVGGYSAEEDKTFTLVLSDPGLQTQLGERAIGTGTILYSTPIVTPPAEHPNQDSLANTGQDSGLETMITAALILFGAGVVLVSCALRRGSSRSLRD